MAPKVRALLGLGNYDEWFQSLRENFGSLGLVRFLGDEMELPGPEPKPMPTHPSFAQWDTDRRLAKEIIKASTVRMAGAMLDAGWNPNAKDPAVHFRFAVKAIRRQAVNSGLVGELVRNLCHADRADFASLVAYQSHLMHLKQRLTHLRYCPSDGFLVILVINGLRRTSPRWAQNLERAVVTEGLNWNGLMLELWEKAVKEQTPGSVGSGNSRDDGLEHAAMLGRRLSGSSSR